jgi:hypothetical protein
VVNRYEDGLSLPAKDIERAVGLSPFEILSEDRERVGRSVNLGQVLVMNGSSPYARSVGKIGDRLAGVDSSGKGGRSLGGLLRTLLPGREKADAEGNGRKPVTGALAGGVQRTNGKDGAATNGGRPPSSVVPSPIGRERPKSEQARVETTRNGRADASHASGISASDASNRTREDGAR